MSIQEKDMQYNALLKRNFYGKCTQRHDIYDKAQFIIQLHLPEQAGQWGKIIACLLTQCFGFCVQELPGVICRLSTRNGKLSIVAR